MTKQLESLGTKLSVTLLAEIEEKDYFRRCITLNLNNTPVVVASSQTLIRYSFFYELLKNASTTPIGTFLFAADSQVQRQADMQLKLVTVNDLHHLPQIIQNLGQHSYQAQQTFWQRTSIFTYHDEEQFELIEILLPELELFF